VQRELALLRAGEIDFATFARRTQRHWQRMAAALMRRWPLPAGVERTDVEQELLLAAWRLVPLWDPKRGPSLHHFVAWNASVVAKKWLHKQRRAKRLDDHAPSRHALAFGSLVGEDDDPERWDRMLREAYDAERLLEWRQGLVDRVARAMVGQEAQVLLLLAGVQGDVEAAAVALYAEPRIRLALRLGNEEAARRVVRRVARAMVDAAETAA
jgi:hypothetical protein